MKLGFAVLVVVGMASLACGGSSKGCAQLVCSHCDKKGVQTICEGMVQKGNQHACQVAYDNDSFATCR